MSTSGEFRTGLISSITVHRDLRQRRELKDIEELAASISRVGLINPILIDRNMVLVAGERRLEACKLLGWDQVYFHFTDEVEETELQALEIEENLRRSELSWQDQVDAIKRYHSIRKEMVPTWSLSDTAEALGESVANISKKISLATEIAAGNTHAAAAPKLSTALGIVQRKLDRAREGELTKVIAKPEAPAQIIQADFTKWVETYEGQPFNLIHCDFPYGVDFGKMAMYGQKDTRDTYADGEDVYWNLIEVLNRNVEKLAGGSCHLFFWFSMDYYEETKRALAASWDVQPRPLIWHRTNGGIMPDPRRRPTYVYETALLCSRGDRHIVNAVQNVVAAPTEKEIHVSQKPRAVLGHFFRMLVDASTRLLDPTCGSGAAVRAAMTAGAQSALGLEINEEYAALAQRALTLELNNAA